MISNFKNLTFCLIGIIKNMNRNWRKSAHFKTHIIKLKLGITVTNGELKMRIRASGVKRGWSLDAK